MAKWWCVQRSYSRKERAHANRIAISRSCTTKPSCLLYMLIWSRKTFCNGKLKKQAYCCQVSVVRKRGCRQVKVYCCWMCDAPCKILKRFFFPLNYTSYMSFCVVNTVVDYKKLIHHPGLLDFRIVHFKLHNINCVNMITAVVYYKCPKHGQNNVKTT